MLHNAFNQVAANDASSNAVGMIADGANVGVAETPKADTLTVNAQSLHQAAKCKCDTVFVSAVVPSIPVHGGEYAASASVHRREPLGNFRPHWESLRDFRLGAESINNPQVAFVLNVLPRQVGNVYAVHPAVEGKQHERLQVAFGSSENLGNVASRKLPMPATVNRGASFDTLLCRGWLVEAITVGGDAFDNQIVNGPAEHGADRLNLIAQANGTESLIPRIADFAEVRSGKLRVASVAAKNRNETFYGCVVVIERGGLHSLLYISGVAVGNLVQGNIGAGDLRDTVFSEPKEFDQFLSGLRFAPVGTTEIMQLTVDFLLKQAVFSPVQIQRDCSHQALDGSVNGSENQDMYPKTPIPAIGFEPTTSGLGNRSILSLAAKTVNEMTVVPACSVDVGDSGSGTVVTKRQMKRAKDAVCNRVASGAFKPAFCELCGALETDAQIEGHHPDYSKIYEVFWVCRQCHCDIHAGDEQAQRVAAMFACPVEKDGAYALALSSFSCDLYHEFVAVRKMATMPRHLCDAFEFALHVAITRHWIAKKVRIASGRSARRNGGGR
jgi:hypothetical protein